MIPPNHGSNLFHDSSLNRTPRENCYISSYKDPNEILQHVPYWAWNLISVVKFLDPEDEPVTRGSPYKCAMLNSPEISHCGKTLMSPNS